MLGAILLLSLAAILYVLYQLLLGGSASTTTVHPATTIPPNARRFASLSDLESAGHLTTPFALTLTEPELNARLQAELAKQPSLPFRDVRAKIADGRIDFLGTANAGGLQVGTTVGIRFFADRGALGYEIESINFGPVPVPAVARQALSDQIDKGLAGQKVTSAWALDQIDARPGVLTIVGRPK